MIDWYSHIMCRERIEVTGLNNQRIAYEVEQYLKGIPHIEDVTADFLDDVIEIEYDEAEVTHEQVLDEIENSGCVPQDRPISALDSIRKAFSL